MNLCPHFKDGLELTVAAATNKGWEVLRLDMKTIFLDGDLEHEVLITQPAGFVI